QGAARRLQVVIQPRHWPRPGCSAIASGSQGRMNPRRAKPPKVSAQIRNSSGQSRASGRRPLVEDRVAAQREQPAAVVADQLVVVAPGDPAGRTFSRYKRLVGEGARMRGVAQTDDLGRHDVAKW